MEYIDNINSNKYIRIIEMCISYGCIFTEYRKSS